ncbi:SpoIIE family protein phosphatase [Thermocatellispora tengchongensis]|uniref:SpoIIE family protein phosphatase n=1 Tax=Thermocatellispora tengchongensis TaxID=1073253 RepID=UPI003645C2A4
MARNGPTAADPGGAAWAGVTGAGSSGEDERLRLLTRASADLSDIEVLEYALDQAVAGLHALGGMVHWAGPVGSSEPRLVASSGLPPAELQAWGETREVIVRALRDGVTVCAPVTRGAVPRPVAGTRAGGVLAARLTAVPLPGPGTPLGVLSVLSDGTAEPSRCQRAFLHTLAGWLSQRLTKPSGTGRPWWQERPAGAQLRQALKAIKIGSWDWNIRTGEVCWDEAALTVLGIDPATGPHTVDTWVELIHPEDHPRVMAATEHAIRTRGLYEVEFRARRPDGTTGWVQERGRLVLDENGEPIRMIGTVWDTTESRAARESVSRALRYMSDAFLAVDREWRVIFVNLDAQRLLGGADPHGRVLWELPAAQVPELREACLRAASERTPASFDAQWPTDGRWYHIRLVPVPDGLTLYLADVTERRMREAEREAAERAAAERAAWLQELTRAFGEAVTAREVVAIVAEWVLPAFGARGLAILTLDDDRLHVAGSSGYGPGSLDEFEGRELAAGSPLADAIRSRLPIFIGSRAEYRRRYPHSAYPVGIGGMRAWALLPLIVPGRAMGACMIAFHRPHRFTSDERTLLTALSGLVAQALSRARMYDTEHNRAQELQRLLLPRDLPSLSGVTAAARYLPAGTTPVGGDWYDIIPLSSERVALVIGDVMGHGLAEAATMGRLRTAVRTLAELDLPPDELLAHLNDLVNDLGDDFYVTCLYAVYDPTSGECAMVSAGHPPPLLVHPDGTVQALDLAPDPPLGAAEPPLSMVELELPEGSVLALYTDGLVESSARDVDAGTAELARRLAGVPPVPRELDRLCASVTEAMLPEPHRIADDAALLLTRAQRLRRSAWPAGRCRRPPSRPARPASTSASSLPTGTWRTW